MVRRQEQSSPQRVLKRPEAREQERRGGLSQARCDPASGAGEPKEVQRQDQRAAGLRSQGRSAVLQTSHDLPTWQCEGTAWAVTKCHEDSRGLKREGKEKRGKIKRARKRRAREGRGRDNRERM